MREVLFIHQGNPMVHTGFADAIGATYIPRRKYAIRLPALIERTLYGRATPQRLLMMTRVVIEDVINALGLPSSKVYFVEGIEALGPAVVKKLLTHRRTKLILLAASPNFLSLGLDTPRRVGRLERCLWGMLSKHIDGCIAVSKLVADAGGHALNCPVRIAYPYVDSELYRRFANITPDLASHNVVSVAVGCFANGMDILVEAFKIVRQQFPDAKLFVIGKGHPKDWERFPGIQVMGFVDDFAPYFVQASLFALIGRIQPFPIATIEALRAGLPVLVSEYTGSKEVIGAMGEGFVTLPDAREVADKIANYFSLSYEQKQHLSSQARELSEPFNKETKCTEFKREFELLLKELGHPDKRLRREPNFTGEPQACTSAGNRTHEL